MQNDLPTLEDFLNELGEFLAKSKYVNAHTEPEEIEFEQDQDGETEWRIPTVDGEYEEITLKLMLKP